MVQNFIFPKTRSKKRRSLPFRRRTLFRALLLVLVLGSASQTAEALQTKGEIVNIVHEVSIAPISFSRLLLCPGETANVYVSVDKTITRRVRGQLIVGNPQTVRNAAIGVSPNPAGIISVQQATPRVAGGLYYVHYVIRGERNGDVELNFVGSYNIGSQQYTATPATLRVRVICKFQISVITNYPLGGERGHSSLSIIPKTIVEADVNAVFQPVTVSVANSASSFGACAGTHDLGDSTATITGTIGAVAGQVRFQIEYGPSNWMTSESCAGKGQGGSGTMSTLDAFAGIRLAGIPMTYNLPQTFGPGTGTANLEIIRLEQ